MKFTGMILFAVGCAVIVVLLKRLLPELFQAKYSYDKIGNLFTAAERSLFGILKQVAGGDIEVFGKVRVADVIAPQKGSTKTYWQQAFNKISNKHFDFVLCNKTDITVICAIELNDSTHKLTSRSARDTFLSNACHSANLPLIQIPAKKSYNVSEIHGLLSGFVNKPINNAFPVNQQEATIVIPDVGVPQTKKCPKCSSEMVKRVARKGANVGKEFWACSGYPDCWHAETIET